MKQQEQELLRRLDEWLTMQCKDLQIRCSMRELRHLLDAEEWRAEREYHEFLSAAEKGPYAGR